MLYRIPTLVTPAQQITVLLGQQPCRLTLYQKTTGFYLDLAVADVPIVTGRIGLVDVPITGLGFLGSLRFTGPASDVAYDSGHTLLWDDGQ